MRAEARRKTGAHASSVPRPASLPDAGRRRWTRLISAFQSPAQSRVPLHLSGRMPERTRWKRVLPSSIVLRPVSANRMPGAFWKEGSFTQPRRSTFLPAQFHSLAARPAPAASVPPGPLRQTLFYRPGCLPVIFFWSSICMDRRSFSTRCATTDLQRTYRGEKSFLAENSHRLSARTAVPF